MKSQIRVHLKSVEELRQMLRGPMHPIDREAIEIELQKRGEGPQQNAPADPAQGTLEL